MGVEGYDALDFSHLQKGVDWDKLWRTVSDSGVDTKAIRSTLEKAGIDIGFLEDQLPGFLGYEGSRRQWKDHGKRGKLKVPEHLKDKPLWQQLDYVSLFFIIVSHTIPVWGYFYYYDEVPW